MRNLYAEARSADDCERRAVVDVRTYFSPERIVSIHPVVRPLFVLRAWLGSVLGWDGDGA